MKWHRERAEAWDRLAGQILAFSGVSILLLSSLLGRVQVVANAPHRHLLHFGLGSSLALLLASVVVALVSLTGRMRSVYTRTEEIQDQWRLFRSERDASHAELLERLATSLIGEPGTAPSAVVDLRNAAVRRERRTRIAAMLLSAGIVCAALVLAGTFLVV